MPIDRPDRPDASRLHGKGGAWFRSGWLFLTACGALHAAPKPLSTESGGPDWIDVRLEKVLRREDVGIPHCEAMVAHQHELAKVRDTISGIAAKGRATRERCLQEREPTPRQACLDSLDPLRRKVAHLLGTQRRLQDSVGRHASGCNSATFKAWEDLELLRRSSDEAVDSAFGTCADLDPPRPSFDRLVEMEIASVWNQERRARELALRTGSSIGPALDTAAAHAFRERIRQYAKRRGGSNPSAQTHFLLAVLDHREGREEQALARLRRIPARDSSTVWKAPVALLYGQILSHQSPDSALALLRTAVSDTALAAPARFLMGRIELERGRDIEALSHFAQYIDLPPGPGPGSRALALDLASRLLSRLARTSGNSTDSVTARGFLARALPRTARDTLALRTARELAADGEVRDALEILSSFQVDYPRTGLGEEARKLLSRIRRAHPGIVVR